MRSHLCSQNILQFAVVEVVIFWCFSFICFMMKKLLEVKINLSIDFLVFYFYFNEHPDL